MLVLLSVSFSSSKVVGVKYLEQLSSSSIFESFLRLSVLCYGLSFSIG